ncbi:MAG: hypothetical protein CMJ40_06030 [Phycisphaerae bacterium]|nr:hypothetical protein [Phycisphaerae bacterium]|tara:strand:- start:366 stop:833 length:468 start_codon:yes stop_codon:yes gene_type:complete
MTTDHNERGTTRLTADDRRLAILDNAELVFVKNGFHATSTREIADACRVTEPVLYRHFKGKEDLFLTMLRRMFEDGIRDLQTQEQSEIEAEQARLRILEALLLCNSTPQIEETGSLARSRAAELKAAFGRNQPDGPGSELAVSLGRLILDRLEID